MFANASPLLVDVFVAALIIAILMITWYLTRLMSKMTETMDEFRVTNNRVNTLVDKANDDYEYVSRTVKGIGVTLDRINRDVLDPLRGVGAIFGMFDSLVGGIRGRFSDEEDDLDYLPEEDYS
ncbi:hypothetical protein KC717_03365 [Candidatus Dojkabacteria bacterium]|uniref:DUF948 domain-containing protein n=1 Tax=Candidatus Dojkabacteria bacterium TaxID=2099670 RepID=A0A955RKP4_9BACT|nr:hypothetical protein [Candidatus Dojkabacteria bacterium]